MYRFTSIPLAQELQKSKLMVTETFNRRKAEIPLELNTIKRPIASSMFAFQRNCTLVSHVPKKNKNVLSISTMHHNDRI